MSEKKLVLVTGGSRGIGLATAKKFAEKGWQVIAFYKNNPGPEILDVEYKKLDVSSEEQVKQGIEDAFKKYNRIDCLVNNAGIFGYAKLQDYTEKLMDEVIGVNEKGVYFMTKHIVGKMNKGSIVNISSTVAHVGSTDPLYAASKAAVLGFTKAMAKSLAPDIRVNAVAPSATETDMMKNYNPERVKQLVEMTLLKKMAKPEEIADAIYFLASEESSHITGICLDVCGGYVMR